MEIEKKQIREMIATKMEERATKAAAANDVTDMFTASEWMDPESTFAAQTPIVESMKFDSEWWEDMQ